MKLDTQEAKEARREAARMAHKRLEEKKEAERIKKEKEYEEEKERAMLAAAQ